MKLCVFFSWFMAYNHPMPIVLIIFSVGLLGVIIYFVVSPKSSRLLRISGIIALGLIGLSLAVCGFFLIKGPSQGEVFLPLPFLPDDAPQPAKKTNIPVIISFLLVFLVILGLIVITSIKEKQRKYVPEKKVIKHEAFKTGDDLEIAETPLVADDSFDIGLD